MFLEISLCEEPEVVDGKTFLHFIGKALDGKCYCGWLCKEELDTEMS